MTEAEFNTWLEGKPMRFQMSLRGRAIDSKRRRAGRIGTGWPNTPAPALLDYLDGALEASDHVLGTPELYEICLLLERDA